MIVQIENTHNDSHMIMSAEDEGEVSCRFTRAAAFNARDRLMACQLMLIDSRDTTFIVDHYGSTGGECYILNYGHLTYMYHELLLEAIS